MHPTKQTLLTLLTPAALQHLAANPHPNLGVAIANAIIATQPKV